MSYYKIELDRKIGITEFHEVNGQLGLLCTKDMCTITMKEENELQMNAVVGLIEENNFNISQQGYNKLGDYYINICKIK